MTPRTLWIPEGYSGNNSLIALAWGVTLDSFRELFQVTQPGTTRVGCRLRLKLLTRMEVEHMTVLCYENWTNA
jgi:hypothetical protein